jgi:HPt (histidine-containing phosphotransfer) domain-containing protein
MESSPIDEGVFAELVQMAGDDGGTFVREVIAIFATSAPEQARALSAAMAQKDAAKSRFFAHKLKGGALMVGALRVVEGCMVIEEQGSGPPVEDEVEAAVGWLRGRGYL